MTYETIAEEIEKLSDKLKHPDKVARMYGVYMEIGQILMKRFTELRKEEK